MDILKNYKKKINLNNYYRDREIAIKKLKDNKAFELATYLNSYYENEENVKKELEYLLCHESKLTELIALLNVIKVSYKSDDIDLRLGDYDGEEFYFYSHYNTNQSEVIKSLGELPQFSEIREEVNRVLESHTFYNPSNTLELSIPFSEDNNVNIIESEFEYYDDYQGRDVFHIDNALYPICLKIEEILNSRKDEICEIVKDYYDRYM